MCTQVCLDGPRAPFVSEDNMILSQLQIFHSGHFPPTLKMHVYAGVFGWQAKRALFVSEDNMILSNSTNLKVKDEQAWVCSDGKALGHCLS